MFGATTTNYYNGKANQTINCWTIAPNRMALNMVMPA